MEIPKKMRANEQRLFFLNITIFFLENKYINKFWTYKNRENEK